ncbi:MAG: hypothetical protein Q7T97_14510 [Burkholderiaceae bacterium]|nr:hypothetical protein [Burkholderiaceae bacterium]
MHKLSLWHTHPIRGPLCIAVALACTCVLAAPKIESPADARYKQERAVCLSDRSHQDRTTCLREADAAHAEARRGGLDVDSAPYADNARRRCDPLPDAQRQACQARMQGQGSISGSATTGGILRELSTPQTDPLPSPR